MTTDGGGWTLAAWSKGFAGRHNVTPDFMVRAVNLQDVHNKEAQNYAASLNVEDLSKSLQTSDVMLKASAYSPTPIIHNNREIWDYNMAACDGSIGHTSRTEGCLNHDANDNFDSVDQFNIALYGYGYNPTLGTPNAAIVPGYSPEICYLHHGWCDFEFYLR